jgi:hypothetical protein
MAWQYVDHKLPSVQPHRLGGGHDVAGGYVQPPATQLLAAGQGWLHPPQCS